MSEFGLDLARGQPAVFPADAHFIAAPGLQAADGSVLPACRKRRQDGDFAGVALQQALGDGGGDAEVD